MKRIFVPTKSADDWKPLLAKPDLHWKPGYSAMSTALSWEAAGTHFPPEVQAGLNSGPPDTSGLELLIAIPEWEVALPGGRTSSHTDVLALARNDLGLVVVAVEAKVDEPFGPTIGEKRAEASSGQTERLDYLHKTLGLNSDLPDNIRYQLLHRSASALLTAQQFHARAAVMVVQSFSPEGLWQGDFLAFADALGASAAPGKVARAATALNPALYVLWCAGDQRYRSMAHT